MTLSDASIRNPVFAVMLSAAMVVFGYLGYREMGISQFPEIDFPVVNVTTRWEASSPDIVDEVLTDVIEDAVSSVEGIDYIQSQSSIGTSVVTIYFHLHRNVDVAMQDVQNAVAAAMHRLPTDVDPPVVSKVNFNKFPVIWLAVSGSLPLKDINRIVDDKLKQHIETINGCGGVMFGGLRRRNMRVWLNSAQLREHNLDAVDVMQAMRREQIELPTGQLRSSMREINVRLKGEENTPQGFWNMPLWYGDQGQVRLGDVAIVEDGLEDRRGFSRFNRVPTVGIGVMRATGANVVQVCDDVKARIPMLQKMLPPELTIGLSTDYSIFIRDDIEEVQLALFLGIILTAVVTFIFLGSIGTTLNVCLSIPVSLIGTFIVMRYFDFTLNFMTLLALSLSVGVVVDDAILVLENIYRRRELGEGRLRGSIRGAREITFAAIAATLSIAAIFIPVAFMKGAIGAFFFQFGIAVTVAVLLSLLVSLTLTPMLCSRFLNVRHMGRACPPALHGPLGFVATCFRRANWFLDRYFFEPLILKPVNAAMRGMSRLYGGTLRVALRHPWLTASSGLALAALALVFAFGISIPLPEAIASRVGRSEIGIRPVGRELVPSEDQSRFIVNVICPVSTNVDYVDEMLQKAEDVVLGLKDPVTGKEVAMTAFAAVSIRPGALVSEGIMFVRLVPADQRTMTQTDVINHLRRTFAAVPGMRAIVLDLSTQGFSSRRGYPVNFAVQGPDWANVIQLSERIRQRMMESGVVADVNTNYRPGQAEVHVVPDHRKAADRGVSVQRIAWVLSVAFGGQRNGRFTDHDQRYDVRVQLMEDQRKVPDRLKDVYVKSDKGQLIPLSDVSEIRTVSTLPVIHRHNHLRKIELTANLAPGVSQGEAVATCVRIANEVREEMELPPGYRVVQLGNAQAMQETLDSLWWALALGFLVAFMILGVQFNSFVHPFTVLLAVPFGVTGALAVLWAAGDTLNMMSMIGLVLLAGLVKKNSIILIDYTNQLRRQGMGLHEAVLTACPVRLRPIVMTSLATIAAAVPLAFGYGPGAETRAPLARSIIGGIVLSTLITLVIVPVFYVLLDRFGAWVRAQTRREVREDEADIELVPALVPALALAVHRNGTNGHAGDGALPTADRERVGQERERNK
jgi:HAE1 family hydrophobic/amphiphilic exporter-1